MTSIPTEETIDATWLTERLNEAGHKVTVMGFQAKKIGTGQTGKSIRYILDLKCDTTGVPTSLVD